MTHTPIDRATFFTNVLQRNALRRQAQLPLLPVRETVEHEFRVALWGHIFRTHYRAVRQEVLQGLRKKHGPDFGNSAGGRWAIEAITKKTLYERYWRNP